MSTVTDAKRVTTVHSDPRAVDPRIVRPGSLVPLLVFESMWKLLWLAAVGLPHLVAGDVDPAFGRTLFSVALVVVILAVTPWDHVWRQYVRAPGDPWRGTDRTEPKGRPA